MTVWNTIDDRYSNFFHLYRNDLLIFARFQSIFSMTLWNTIDYRYSNVVLYIEMKPHFLIFCFFQSIFIMVEWNHIDDRYSNILVILR